MDATSQEDCITAIALVELVSKAILSHLQAFWGYLHLSVSIIVDKTTSGFNSDRRIQQYAHGLLLESQFVPSSTRDVNEARSVRGRGRGHKVEAKAEAEAEAKCYEAEAECYEAEAEAEARVD